MSKSLSSYNAYQGLVTITNNLNSSLGSPTFVSSATNLRVGCTFSSAQFAVNPVTIVSVSSPGVYVANQSANTTSNTAGIQFFNPAVSGTVPAPASTDVGKFLSAAGTWESAGGGSSPVYRAWTVVANGVTGFLNVVAYGSQSDLNGVLATPSATGDRLTLSNIGSLIIKSVTINTPAGFNTTTSWGFIYPSTFSNTNNTWDAPFPTLIHYNGLSSIQSQTNTNLSSAGGVITIFKSGLVASTAAHWNMKVL